VLHRFSVCTDDGELRLTLVFKKGTDVNIAMVLVMNRVAIAQATLPDEVRRIGVTIKKRPAFLFAVSLVSSDGSRDRNELAGWRRSYEMSWTVCRLSQTWLSMASRSLARAFIWS